MPEINTLPEAVQEVFDTRPQKVTLIRSPGQKDATAFPVLFNPASLDETIEVAWSRLQVIGLDHEVPHYTNTKSLSYSLEFYWSQFQFLAKQRNVIQPRTASNQRGSVVETPQDLADGATAFLNFMRSLCFPTRSGLRPPTIHIVWPGVFNLIGVAEGVDFAFTRFDSNLTPLVYRATLQFLETRATRRYSEDVARSGLEADPPLTRDNKPTVS